MKMKLRPGPRPQLKGRAPTYDMLKIKNAIKTGKSDKIIAAEIGCSWVYVQQVRLRLRILKKTGPKPRIDYEKVKNLYNLGKLDKEIAEELNCMSFNISTWRYKKTCN